MYNFLIKEKIFNDWILLDEKITIQGYDCLKAFGIIDVDNFKHPKQTINAIYCPKLNFNFGPIGFSSLPGLIVQIEWNNVTYYLDKIEFLNEKISIELPSDGKIISKEDFNKERKKRMPEILRETLERRKKKVKN